MFTLQERENAKEDKLYKEPTYRHIGNSPMYAIMRVGKKHKSFHTVSGFQKHMEREVDVKNADNTIENELLIGSSLVYQDFKNYIKDCKLRTNSVLAREILLTASPQFFKGLSSVELEQWKVTNKQWLLKNFGNNCLYATLHKDETTWHIHALVVPKFENSKGEKILSNTRYFDGIEKLRGWQDNYASDMQSTFKQLQRGNKYSKATHIDIKKYYSLINAEVNINDIEQLKAKSMEADLLYLKVKAIQKTLDAYKRYNNEAVKDKEEVTKDMKHLRKENTVYNQAVKILSKRCGIKESEIKSVLKYAEQSLENTKSR